MRPWIDQNRVAIDDRIAIIPYAIFFGRFVVLDAGAWQYGADADIFLIGVGRNVPLDDIRVEPWTLVDSKNARHSACDATQTATNHGADGPCRPFSVTSALRRSSRNALGMG